MANSGPPGKWRLKQTQSDGWLVDWCSTALKGWMIATQVCDKKCRNEYGYGILRNPMHAWTITMTVLLTETSQRCHRQTGPMTNVDVR